MVIAHVKWDTPFWLPLFSHCHHSKWFFQEHWTMVYLIPFFNCLKWLYCFGFHLVTKINFREMCGFCMWNAVELDLHDTAFSRAKTAEKFSKICQKCWKAKWTKDGVQNAAICVWLQSKGKSHLLHPLFSLFNIM